MNEIKTILACVRTADKKYNLINPNDKIAVGISGGKDSMIMAKLFEELHKHSEFEFNVKYLVMNPGYNEENLNQIKKNLDIMKINAEIHESNIFEVAKSYKQPLLILAHK